MCQPLISQGRTYRRSDGMTDREKGPDNSPPHISLSLLCEELNAQNPRVTRWAITLALLTVLSASLALAEDFKTINGKEYKDATISRVEADGIVIRTKTGISKIYFVELPKDVQERFRYPSATPLGKAVAPRIEEPQGTRVGGQSFADRFAAFVEKKLDEREAILHGKHTPGPAELMVRKEVNFHWAFLAGIALIASVLFAVVWARFK